MAETNDLLEKRIQALSGMATDAGWRPETVSGLGELMRLSSQRKEAEAQSDWEDWKRKTDYTNSLKEGSQPWDPTTDSTLQRQLYLDELEKNKPVDPAVQSYVNQIKSGGIKSISQVPASVRDAVVVAMEKDGVTLEDIEKNRDGEVLVGWLEDLKTLADEATIGDKLTLDWSGDIQKFNTTKDLAVAQMTKMFENGRLSDADRVFYQQVVGLNPWGRSSKKNEIIDNLIKRVKQKTGISLTTEPGKTPAESTVSRNAVVKNLKSAGYSDEEVKQYLEVKGL